MKLSIRKKHMHTLFSLVVASTTILAGCGSNEKPSVSTTSPTKEAAKGSSLTPVNFQLNWSPGGFNAGFALALQKGYYKDEGLDVTIVPGNGSLTAAQLVATGKENLAYADAAPVMQLISKGAPMKIVSTIYQSNPNEVTALEGSGIKSIADLKGKSVGIASGGSQNAMLPLLLGANGLNQNDIKLVSMANTALAQSLMEHKVDAILGSMDFYGIQFQEQGVKTVDFPFYNHGVATVSTSIIASDEYMKSHGDTVKKFVRASLRGWEEAFKNPQDAIDSLGKTFPNASINKERSLKELAVTKTLAGANTKYIGKAVPEVWAKSQEILSESGSLPKGIDPTKYYTYDFLPSDLPAVQ